MDAPIENYICTRAALEAYATASATDAGPGPLFTVADADRRLQAMRESIDQVESALKTLRKGSPWDADVKASDEFLDPLFRSYFGKLDLPNLMAKKNFHELAEHVPDREIDPEIREKLDAIARVAERAAPADDGETAMAVTRRAACYRLEAPKARTGGSGSGSAL